MRMTTGSLTVAAALVFGMMAFWPDAQDGPAPALAQEKAAAPADEAAQQAEDLGVDLDNEATAKRLRKRIEADFAEMPLQDVLESIADAVMFQFLIDGKALEFAGISTDTPVTIRLYSVPTDFLLELILRRLELGYTIREGIVIVTTPEEVENALDMRVYDVRDLLSAVSVTETAVENKTPVEKPAGFDGANRVPAKFAQRGGGGGQGGGGGGQFPKSPPVTPDEELIALITATVMPGSWHEAGGPGSIRYYHGALVVAQTQEVHREIRQLLDELSKVATLRHAPKLTIIDDNGGGGFF